MLIKILLSKTAASLVVILLLSGCAREISPDVYKAGHIGESSFTYQGVVSSVRYVKVDESEYMSGSGKGMFLGALGGAAAGSQIGSGSGSSVATVAGLVLGGVAGAMAEKALGEQEAAEYVVKLTNGSVMTIVQGKESSLQVGQKVLVMVSLDGRSRVLPDSSPTQEVQPLVVQSINKITTCNKRA